MTTSSSAAPLGRPREFQPEASLQAALMVFWRRGYAATTLDDLTAAMGLSRSSFYGAFGSKHEVLLAAVGYYVDGIFASLQAIVSAGSEPTTILREVMREIAKPDGGDEGCLLVNAIAELAPGDREVCGVAQAHVSRVLALIEALLLQAGHTPCTAEPVAGALLSFAFGATMLRKAGLPTSVLNAFAAQSEQLFTPLEGTSA